MYFWKKNHIIPLVLIAMCIFFSCRQVKNIMEIPLYGNKPIPGILPETIGEKTILVEDGSRRIYYVSHPALTGYFPRTSNGTAIIICPGGGYGRLSIDHEGVEVAKALNAQGITAFVLKYRLPNDTLMQNKAIAPLQDAQQAIRFVRLHAKEWKISNNKIGIMGFSAGGHLAATAATHFQNLADPLETDTTSVRPDFTVLIYPVISMMSDSTTHVDSRKHLLGDTPTEENKKYFSNEFFVNQYTPPCFIVHAENDKAVPVRNSILFYEECIKNNVPVEMHLYPYGGHGFGLHNPTTADQWLDKLIYWLHSQK